MRRKILIIISILLMISATALTLFPSASKSVGEQLVHSEIKEFKEIADHVVADDEAKTYEEALEQGEVDEQGYLIDRYGNRTSSVPVIYKADLDRLYRDSVNYNNKLKENQRDLLINSQSYEQACLDLSSYGIFNGIYGYVSAPSIGMELPIYLGANDSSMSRGAAHLNCTSLPIGGESTNCVLAGHTGYIGRIFFDYIVNLNIGDTVQITNYRDTLTYTVVDCKTVKDYQSENIFINDERDLLTLITCISNGKGGFNRYYVICERN